MTIATEKLTKTQEQALVFIQSSLESSGKPPTLRELCAFMGYSAVGSAQDLIAALRRKGYLEKSEKRAARSFRLTTKARRMFGLPVNSFPSNQALSVPILGSVPAGNPLEAIEEQVGTLQLAYDLIPNPKPSPSELFALRAQGQSMIHAGIMDGDWLVVKCQNEATVGAIVVARLDEEATVKRLMHNLTDGWYLKPENDAFSNIYARNNPFEVIGLVIALQRSFPQN